MDYRSRLSLLNGRVPGADDFVFSYRDRPWSTRRLYDAFQVTVAGCKDAIPDGKLSQLRLHDVRHSVGAILATGGLSLEIIAKVLGHKSLETTRRYAHLMPSVMSHAAKILAAAIPEPPAEGVCEPHAG